MSASFTKIGTVNRCFQGWIDWGDTAMNMPADGTELFTRENASVSNSTDHQKTLQEAIEMLTKHPDFARGNSTVHYVAHSLKSLTD
jgi:hypothetical protein